jgi:hypothetical protein
MGSEGTLGGRWVRGKRVQIKSERGHMKACICCLICVQHITLRCKKSWLEIMKIGIANHVGIVVDQQCAVFLVIKSH